MAKTPQAAALGAVSEIIPGILKAILYLALGYVVYLIAAKAIASVKSGIAYKNALQNPDSPEAYAKTLYDTGIAKSVFTRWVDGDELLGIAQGIKKAMFPEIIDAYKNLYEGRSLRDDIDGVAGITIGEFEAKLRP